jgi:hypothetical protein
MFLRSGHSIQLIINNYITTLNAAVRHVAESERMTLIDFEAIALQLPTAHLYTSDGTHPIGDLSAAVIMNLLLNEYDSRSGSAVIY